jgi:hypothetical protein
MVHIFVDGGIDQKCVEEFSRNPFRTFVLQTMPRGSGTTTQPDDNKEGMMLRLEGHVLPTRLHLSCRGMQAEEEVHPCTTQGVAASGVGQEEGATMQEVFLMLSLPGSSSAQDLKVWCGCDS